MIKEKGFEAKYIGSLSFFSCFGLQGKYKIINSNIAYIYYLEKKKMCFGCPQRLKSIDLSLFGIKNK
jgi:hypothetical protein